MPTARLCPLADVAALIPADCWLAERMRQDPGALADETVLWITGDVQWPALHLDAPLASGSPQRQWWQGLQEGPGDARLPRSLFLILIDGHLQVDGALTCDDTDGATHLIVRGDTQARNAVVGGQLMLVRGALRVQDLLWGHYNHGELRVHGGLQARVALFTDEYGVHIEGPEQVDFLQDEVRPGPHLAEFSAEVLGAVFAPKFLSGTASGEDGLAGMLDRPQVVAAVRAGDSAVRGSADIHAAWPMAHDLCADNTISVENILAVVHTPVVAHKEHKAYGWFQQTDFSVCQRHVDEDGDQRDDNVFITVWKTWDFYLSVEQLRPRGLLARMVAALLRRPAQAGPELTLLYRSYQEGEPGEWKPLSQSAAPEAWEHCQKAWRGVLDYVRKAVGQHRARYPLYQRLEAELSATHIEDFTRLPVFTERYNDWWDSDRNGHWQGDVWVGARQPCMHDGEPWGRALKFSWENGSPAQGDDEDNAHSVYQVNVDEAREGPALVEFTYAQRQSEARVALPRGAADHVARLLRFYQVVQARLREEHARDEEQAAEARRIEAAVRLLATPPLAPDLPDAAVFPLELMTLSEQWQAGGREYVAAVRAHQLAMDASRMQACGDDNATTVITDAGNEDEDGEEQDENALPPDPRKGAAPTVLQLARVVNAHADEELGERFRQRFAFAPDAFVQRAAKAGVFIGPVIALDDGRVLARIGPAYDDTAHWVALQGTRHTPLPSLRGLGRSHDRQVFARSDGLQITTHRGFEGPVVARFDLPRGNEGLPPHVAVAAGPLGQRCDEIIPFNDGQRVLLRNPTGIYLLTSAEEAGSGNGGHGGVQRLHPQTFEEDGPYTWPKNQMDEEVGGQTLTVLALDMLHMALSPDERHIAVGDQDSQHVLLDAQGALLAEYEPRSSYPHHAAFSHDGARLFANSCHLYWGSTLSVPLAPQPAAPGAENLPALDERCRVYASATQPGLAILGDADGYLHAIGDDGRPLWRHHVGSTISAIEISPDGSTLWAASYGGYLAKLEYNEAGMDPHSIGTSPYAETRRWIFWSDEAGPLRW
ncbi:WD40 repeat domain-containing protein [Acidovorax sp. sic0104]|uniref:WD40 repeat domain-containing protein n=1 Tax=Acidovorax sp. sic0104 TaxID=2854784 RepID=UPI001C45F16B|nr:WD40 repeat domain-containing protein [Acidovorax sp. sic0104]MBV7542736.1 WD40 repeat domain-containing protein [Acidovorax sp. sic0104]